MPTPHPTAATTVSAHTASAHTVVVLHAHPDDEAIFTALTIRRLADAGARVVLVTATDGAAGVPRLRLAPGETLRSRRLGELERACELLGVARLEVLGYTDSGAHRGPYGPGTLAAAAPAQVADQVQQIVEQEGASTLVHYDARGIYGHVDHVQVHRAGSLVVQRTGLTGYQATVDTQALRTGPRHVLHGAAGADLDVGVPSSRIAVTVQAGTVELLAKMAAMSAHASQIGPHYLDPPAFAAGYGQEWFVRDSSAPGVLESLPDGARHAPDGRHTADAGLAQPLPVAV
ncbi:MAG TPA: PIG-L deacetylase family protein [Kineosporiaceae bacterium]